MLQVTSGKFFSNKEIITSKGYFLVYSNIFIHLPIKTALFSIFPMCLDKYPFSYFIEYQNRVEKEEPQIITRIEDFEIIDQIIIVLSFGFKSFFSIERDEVIRLCDRSIKSPELLAPISYFVLKYLDEINEATPNEIDQFRILIEYLKDMPRDDYELVLSALKTIYHSLKSIKLNFDLAYSMLIYSLESFSQKIDTSEPIWMYFDPSTKKKLDMELNNICKGNGDRIKTILLESTHQRALQKFIHFIIDSTENSFFIEESWRIIDPVKKDDYIRAVRNSYDIRSRYVHELEEILKQLKVYNIGLSEIFIWENNPFFTYRGLLRVCNHVIISYIKTREVVIFEEIDWRIKQKNVVRMKIHPKHTIFLTNGFEISHTSKKYSDLLDMIKYYFLFNESFVDITDILKIFEQKIEQKNVKENEKIAMYAMYYLYNNMVEEKGKTLHWNDFLKKYVYLANICNIQNFPIRILMNVGFPWDLKSICKVFSQYYEQKYSKNAFVMNDFFESLISLSIGNQFFYQNNLENWLKYYNLLLYNNPGNINIQKVIQEMIHLKRVINRDEFIDLLKQDALNKNDIFQSRIKELCK